MSSIDFYLPFWWSDHVYEDFDRWEESWTTGIEHYKFLWDFEGHVPLDGILFSRNDINESRNKQEKVTEAGGIKNFLRIPDDIHLFGDCGAFGYREEDSPPYDPLETLDFYEDMQYDHGCTVDHLISGKDDAERERRFRITQENAQCMKRAHKEGNYSFNLFGVAQGWDPKSYRRAVENLLEFGFDHIALGGLLQSQSKTILRILKTCYPVWRGEDVQVHLFGTARWKLFPFMQDYGITSIDNAYHRTAWLNKKKNYELSPTNHYTAVRIPISDQYSEERLPEEQAVFDEVKAFTRNTSTAESVVESLEEYEKEYAKLKDKESRIELFHSLKEEYLRTLRDQPWKECPCPICDRYGVHVAIFRRNERNMRRGFHNLYRFYRYFRKYQEGEYDPPEMTWEIYRHTKSREIPPKILQDEKANVLVISSCSKRKTTQDPEVSIPAEDVYNGRLFNTVRELCRKFGFDHRIISAKYGLLSPDQEIGGYDKVLENEDQVERMKQRVLPELSKLLVNYDYVLLIAGRTYRSVVEELMDHRFIVIDSDGYVDLCSTVQEAIPKQREPTQQKLYE